MYWTLRPPHPRAAEESEFESRVQVTPHCQIRLHESLRLGRFLGPPRSAWSEPGVQVTPRCQIRLHGSLRLGRFLGPPRSAWSEPEDYRGSIGGPPVPSPRQER